jgi:hypothetical protein
LALLRGWNCFFRHFSNSFPLPACQNPAHPVNPVIKLPEQLQPLMGIIGLYLVLIRVILGRLNNSFGTVCASIFDEPWEWLPATIIAARCRSHSKKGENHFAN